MTDRPAGAGRTASNPPSDPSGTGGGFRAWGTVHASVGGVYDVALDEGGVIEASIRGRLKREVRTGDRVVVGDRVQVSDTDGSWTVEEVSPRRTAMVRRKPGGRSAKVVAANLDRVFIVMAARDPEIHTELLDRLLVVAASSGLEASIVLNKVDLDGSDQVAADLSAVYEPLGLGVLPVSASTGQGMEALTALLCQGTSAMVGPSGAGKSTLLNHIDPGLDLRTGELSRKTGRGRHTTVSSRLIRLSCGGLVADTPGFSDVGLWSVDARQVATCFPEIEALEGGCRFRGCAHETEPECVVLEAVAAGGVARSRYDSYRKLRAEAVAAGRHD